MFKAVRGGNEQTVLTWETLEFPVDRTRTREVSPYAKCPRRFEVVKSGRREDANVELQELPLEKGCTA